MKKEIRSFESSLKIEQRAEGEKPVIRGHAAVFNKLSEKLGWFREIILPGAFDNVLDNDVRALFNHDSNLILGRTKSGTLKIGVDSEGLYYEIEPADTQASRDLMVSIERGDVSQSSFGFIVSTNGDEWKEDENGDEVRYIRNVQRLFDVSPVTFPAYPDTDVAKRSHDEFVKEHEKKDEFDYQGYKTTVNKLLKCY